MISICVGGDSDLAQTEPADVKFGRLAKDSKKRRIYTVPDGYSQKIRQLQANATRAFQHRVILYHPLLQPLLQEAVAVAVEACADDTKGQVCYICTQALHWKTKEGLVRGCSCRGTSGVAHVSCLVEQAKILVAEAEDNNLGHKALDSRWARWYTCSLCEQDHHGAVCCALVWGCWKTYVGRPVGDGRRHMAMTALGNGLFGVRRTTEAVAVFEAAIETSQRLRFPGGAIVAVQNNLAFCYGDLGRNDEMVSIQRSVHAHHLSFDGPTHDDTILAAFNLANSLGKLGHYAESKSILRDLLPGARGLMALRASWAYANDLLADPNASVEDLRESVAKLTSVEKSWKRVMGPNHPELPRLQNVLRRAHVELAARAPES